MPPPDKPKIYHIVHVDRLASIIVDGFLFSDAKMIQRPGQGTIIGMSDIKQQRLTRSVGCHKGTYVGDYVPFNFCPRSVMLYVIHRGNKSGLSYKGGQGPIVHMEADLHQTVKWAETNKRLWAFSLSNAARDDTRFYCDMENLTEVNWLAVATTDFSSPDIQEGKQAEFLMHGSFPWSLVERIGVYSQDIAEKVASDMQEEVTHRPKIEIKTDWYY